MAIDVPTTHLCSVCKMLFHLGQMEYLSHTGFHICKSCFYDWMDEYRPNPKEDCFHCGQQLIRGVDTYGEINDKVICENCLIDVYFPDEGSDWEAKARTQGTILITPPNPKSTPEEEYWEWEPWDEKDTDPHPKKLTTRRKR